MNVPNKIVSVLFVLALLGFCTLWGCKSSKAATPQNDATPAVQSEEAESAVDNAPVEDGAAGTKDDANVTLVLIADEITTLEPYQMINTHPDGSVASHIWDTLTLLNADLQVEPNLAESWRLINNFTWEFKLRQGITFHNGETLDAQAVRFSIERAQSMPGSLETFAEDVAIEGIEIIDDYTLRITSRQPIVNLPLHLAFLEILAPDYYSETPLEQLAIAPVGSGPYRLEQWLPGQKLTLEAVPTYWKGTPALPRLVFQTLPHAEERLTALREGQAALVSDLYPIPDDQWDAPTSKLAAIESTQHIFIGIHIEAESPLGDKRVRQALNYGVNVEQIVDDCLEGYGERYGSWIDPPLDNPELTPWPYDVNLAHELLAEAGYQEGFSTILYTPVNVYHQDAKIAQTVAQQLAEIGVTVQVKTVDWTTYVHQLLSDDVPPLFLLGLNSRGDGLEDVKSLSAAFAFNPTGWENESFEDTVKQATSTFNKDLRTRLVYEAQAIAYAEAPWIWLWRQYDFYGISNDLDWTPRRDGLINLYKPADTVPAINE